MNIKSFFRKTRKIGRIATELTKILPNKDDGTISIIIKMISGLEIVERHLFGIPISKRDEFFDDIEVSDKRNANFVDIFFSTPLHEAFEEKCLVLEPSETIIMAQHPDIGTLYFLQFKFGDSKEPSTHFWFSPDFRFDLALELLWKIYDQRIHVNMVYDKCMWRLRTVCSHLPVVNKKLVGRNEQIVSNLVMKHKCYADNNVARTYLFVGKPGVGKSMAALKFADHIGNKTLRIDASGLTSLTMDDLSLLIVGLTPNVVIMDDVDKVHELQSALPTLLTLFQDMHRIYPHVTFILTAADLKVFDSAMIRPERIDVIVRFASPDNKDRQQLIHNSLTELGLQNHLSDVETIAAACDGLTAAYIQEACLRLKYDTLEEVLAYLKDMVELFAEKKDNSTNKNNSSLLAEAKVSETLTT
jgi:DNA polymerase III delta prime subunit